MKLDTDRGALLSSPSRFWPKGAGLLAATCLAVLVHVGCQNQSKTESRAHGEAASERRVAVERAEAIRRAELGDLEDRRLVESGLESADPLVSGAAISKLMQASPERLRRVLRSVIRGDAASPAERMLVSWLASGPTADAVGARGWPVCRWSRTAQQPGARSFAAAACARQRSAAGGPVEPLMNDPHWVVRCRVASALADEARTKPQIRAWLARWGSKDPHPTVRRVARRALAGHSGTGDAQIHDRAEPQQP